MVSTMFNPESKAKGTRAEAEYNEFKYLTHMDLRVTPMDLRHSAITNRVIDWNDKTGIAKGKTFEDARMILCKLANSGGSNPSDDVVERYSYVFMKDHDQDEQEE